MTAPQFQRRRKVKVTRIVVEHRGKTLEGEAAQLAMLEAGQRLLDRAREKQLEAERVELNDQPADTSAMGRATAAIEERLVQAFATIARLPVPRNDTAPRSAQRNGVDYFHEKVDSLARFVDAAAGKWESVDRSRPPSPSPQAIDQANRAIEWLLLIEDEPLRRILVVGATSKRGNVKRRIAWAKLAPLLPQWADRSNRTKQRAYCQAIHSIMEGLTLEGLK